MAYNTRDFGISHDGRSKKKKKKQQSRTRFYLFIYFYFLIFVIRARKYFVGEKAYVRVLKSLWLFLFPVFLFAAQPKEFFLDGLKKLQQRSHKYVELSGEYVK
jgi:hypothetical protein